MDETKKKRLEAKGWRVGSVEEFLELSAAESAYIELKLALADSLKKEREQQHLTQVELAELLQSSQSRIAKMEAGDPSVTLDLLVRGLLALGISRETLAQIVTRPPQATAA